MLIALLIMASIAWVWLSVYSHRKTVKQTESILASLEKVKRGIGDLEIFYKVRNDQPLTFEETARHIAMSEEYERWVEAGKPNMDVWEKRNQPK